MRKKLESELVSIAHRILKLKGKEDVLKLHAETTILLEKLTVLKFAYENFENEIPTVGNDSSFLDMLEQTFNDRISDNIEIGDRIYVNLDEKEDDGIMEPAIEKIKNMVAYMPDFESETTQAEPIKKTNFEDLTADFKDMPVFEPVTKTVTEKKSLNDTIKLQTLNIGLNDKIAFIKHLFNGNNADYERVVSQLNTFNSLDEALNFIQDVVKPDYNHWQDKDEIEVRFLQIIENKF
ncbi:MAG: hypothetical protein ACK5MZ_06435 [Aestuariibaculum sp.]